MTAINDAYIASIEEEVGMDIEEIRSTPLSELRKIFEKRNGGKRMTFKSFFPFIGRGNVLGDRLVSHDEVEATLDSVLESLETEK